MAVGKPGTRAYTVGNAPQKRTVTGRNAVARAKPFASEKRRSMSSVGRSRKGR